MLVKTDKNVWFFATELLKERRIAGMQDLRRNDEDRVNGDLWSYFATNLMTVDT
jgi:hypothetical protein